MVSFLLLYFVHLVVYCCVVILVLTLFGCLGCSWCLINCVHSFFDCIEFFLLLLV